MKYTDPYSGLFGGRKLENIKMSDNLKAALAVLFVIFVIGVLVLWSGMAPAQTVVSDEYYKERCLDPQFSPAAPDCPDLRPRSAPLDCSQPDFSPEHGFCTPEQKQRDADTKCGVDFSPLPPECIINELY